MMSLSLEGRTPLGAQEVPPPPKCRELRDRNRDLLKCCSRWRCTVMFRLQKFSMLINQLMCKYLLLVHFQLLLKPHIKADSWPSSLVLRMEHDSFSSF